MISPVPRAGTLQEMQAANERILAAASRNGWGLWFVDHLQSGEMPYLEGWTHMVHSSARFPELTIGNIVLCQNYRNPGLVANMAATLQFLSGGKLIFGIGAGWKEDEYLAYNYDFPRPGVRLDQLEEALQVITALWSGERVTVEGEHYRVTDAIALPAPDPVPPIMIGGNGNRTVGIAARYADWWNSDLVTPAVVREKVALLKDKSVAAGRAPDAVRVTSFNMLSMSRDPDKVVRQGSRPEIHVVAGTPDEVRDQIAEYRDAGVTYMQINFMDFPSGETLELFEEIAKDL
ncbi:MAG: LLM class flavin-dependent oxidoreductase [Thermomicrobiales bacterium]|nr:LLM class flavin-dependent oxidoreductase [Thermomicrobiales bacterium]